MSARTVRCVTRRTATSPTALNSLLEQASELLDDEARSPQFGPGPEGSADPTGVLVEAGWFMLQQLKIVLGFTINAADADRLVPDVLDRASAFGIASAPTVGAAASIVDQVRADDPMALARTIMAARGAFGDDEVFSGVCALIAALSAQIADCLALDPCVVHDELSERAGRNIEICRPVGGRTRSPAQFAERLRCQRHVTRTTSLATVSAPIVLAHP